MTDIVFITKTKNLIDSLKTVCANFGLGNDGNEFKIITQVFLYKFINDKFRHEAKKVSPKLDAENSFQAAFEKMNNEEINFLLARIGNKAPKLKPEQTIDFLFSNQNKENFAKDYFDATLLAISKENTALYSVKSSSGAKDLMFDELSQFISDSSQRDAFCKALISKLIEFSFENMFGEKYDFFATIFEYLIKDYNSDSGGKYAEYYTPQAVARIMAAILVGDKKSLKGVKCYDPSAGSGTLLMSIAHAIGEKNCTIYSEDISQKSSNMLRLNLVLNNLSHSIPNVIKGNTILESFYRNETFDYIVSNPPFKLDFSDFHEKLEKDSNKERFFAGIPKIPNKDKDKMSIYLLFIQHIMFCLDKKKGKAAIVVPTGFITAQSGIEKKIREALIQQKMLHGVVSMPSNIFASTGTNVSVLFLDTEAGAEQIILVDASKLGETVKEGKNQRTVLAPAEEQRIVDAMNEKRAEDDFSVVVSAEEIVAKNYSFSAGQYFEVKIEYVDITAEEFEEKMKFFTQNLDGMFANRIDWNWKLRNNWRDWGMSNWRRVDSFILYTTKGITPKYIEQSSIIVLNQKCIRNNHIDYSYAQYTDDSVKIKDAAFIEVGDILINSTGQGTAGRCAFVDKLPQNRVVVDSHILRLKCNSYYEAQCLAYSLYSIEGLLQTFIDGSTGQGEFDRVRLFNLLSSIPEDDKIQQKIASVLSSLDHKIELNNRINAELEAMAKTIYDYWFVQFDFPNAEGKPYKSSRGKMVFNEDLNREIPERWRVKKLKDLTPISNASLMPNNYPKVFYKHYSIPVFDERKTFIKECGENIMSNKFIVGCNDILVSKLNPWFNRVIYVPNLENQICSTEFVVWRTPSNSLKNYLYLIATNNHFISYCIKMAAGTSNSHKRVSPTVMMKYKVAYDKLISEKFGLAIDPIIGKMQTINKENQHLASLRDWLLPMLMNGQIGFKNIYQEKNQSVSIAAEPTVSYRSSKPQSENYHKIQSVYAVLWANSEIGVQQGEMALAKDLYLIDRIAGINTGFNYAQHNWGSFDPSFKKTINNKQYFVRRNFPNSKATYCDLNDKGYLLPKISEETKEKVRATISELHNKIFTNYFGTKKAEMKELCATVLKCIEDTQSIEFPAIRRAMKEWKTPKQQFSDKAAKFSEQQTRETLGMILREEWHKNVMKK